MMDKTLASTRRKFTIITIAVSALCATFGSLAMYALAESRLNTQINASKIGALTADNPSVSAYLASQEKYHAHFETIASAIQSDERQQISRVLPVLTIAAAAVSGLAGWLLSRRLLVPVKESFLSQRRFMQDAAHELRNPLAAMKTMVQQARSNPPAASKLSNFLRAIENQLNQLSAITTDLLLLERRENPGTEKVDLVALLQDVVEQLHHQATAAGVKVRTMAPKQLEATIDPSHFVYIAKNLIENAIKFSNKNNGKVTVRLDGSTKGWHLQVKDNGIGIPADDLANITQRFYRGSNTAKTEGTGLGMAIVAKFVNIYKGKLEIQSNVGTGTNIQVLL